MGRIAELDGLRAVAISLVIAAHTFHSPTGMLGVQIFFAISGYIITRTLLVEFETTGAISIRGFYIRRACRILPPLWLYLLVVTALGLSSYDSLAALLFMCNVNNAECGWYVGHTWSLAFEEQFYLIYPWIVAFVVMRRRPSFVLLPALVFAAVPFYLSIPWIGKSGFIKTYALLFGGAALAFWNPRLALPRVLGFAPIAYVGRISYSLYLWQQLATAPHIYPEWQGVALVGAVIVSAISFHTLERFFVRLGRATAERTIATSAAALSCPQRSPSPS